MVVGIRVMGARGGAVVHCGSSVSDVVDDAVGFQPFLLFSCFLLFLISSPGLSPDVDEASTPTPTPTHP